LYCFLLVISFSSSGLNALAAKANAEIKISELRNSQKKNISDLRDKVKTRLVKIEVVIIITGTLVWGFGDFIVYRLAL
jgi:hypothetical protein